MTDKRAALAEIAALAEKHRIEPEEIAAYLAGERSPAKDRTVVGKVLSYVGGALVFSGIGLLIGFLWDDIGAPGRVVLTFGAGLAAFVLATLCAGDPRFEKAATPLSLVAALMQPTGLFVFLHETMPPSDDPELAAILVFGVLAAQQGLAFWALKRTSLLFLALVFWMFCLGTAMVWLDWNEEIIGIVLGTAMLCLSWGVGRTPHRAIAPFWSFTGGATLLASWWAQFESTSLDLTFLGLDAFLIYLAVRTGNRSLLFVSVLGLLAYMSYFAWEYFADVIGWPIALIVLGLVLIGVTGWAVKLGKSPPGAE
jgi:hypothetical protein